MGAKAKHISLDLINEFFEVKNSKLIWKTNKANCIKIGDEAGSLGNKGYRQVTINGKIYRAHRIIYMIYHNMEIPIENQIDHIDGNKLNNSIENLRLVTNQENHFNRTKAKGYTWCKNAKKFLSRIGVNGKYKHLGSFDTKDEARDAYLKAKKELHLINKDYE